MTNAVPHILVLCTGNSTRSIMAECLINDLGHGNWLAFSAGCHATGQINPLTLEVLREKGHQVESFRSKSWDEFATPTAPHMDLVITVSDIAAGEPCPHWPGHPAKLHMAFPNPATTQGGHDQQLAAFRAVYDQIEVKIRRLIALGPDRAAEV